MVEPKTQSRRSLVVECPTSNQAMAEDMQITFGQSRDSAGDLGELVKKQWVQIQGLIGADRYKTEALNTVLKEEAKLRALLRHLQKDSEMDFEIRKRHKHLTNVLAVALKGGEFRYWELMPADVPVSPDDEAGIELEPRDDLFPWKCRMC